MTIAPNLPPVTRPIWQAWLAPLQSALGLMRLIGAPRGLDLLLVGFLLFGIVAQNRYVLESVSRLVRSDVVAGTDFAQDYLLAKAIITNTPIYLPLPDLAERFGVGGVVHVLPHPTPHPPTLGVMFIPFALMTLPAAVTAWLAIQFGCLFISSWLMLRLWRGRGSWPAALLLSGVVLSWPIASSDIFVGNLNLVLLALALGCWRLLQTNRPWLAGLPLGCALLMKPLLWPILLWLTLGRRWSAVATTLLVGGVGVGATVLIVGWTQMGIYLAEGSKVVNQGYSGALTNLSLASLGPRLFRGMGSEFVPEAFAPPLADLPALASFLAVAAPLVAIGATLLAARRLHDPNVGYALVLGICSVTGPIAWSHYLLIALPVIGGLIVFALRHGCSRRQANLITLMSILLIPTIPVYEVAMLFLSGYPSGPPYPISTLGSLALLGPACGVIIALRLRYCFALREQLGAPQGP